MGFESVCLLALILLVRVETVPPEACFANFRWDDCGHTPVPVMYYWKPGSRCEVGLWRGCVPNTNMFTDEFECVTTCIFASRALPSLYHSMNEVEPEETTDAVTAAATECGNGTETTGDATTGGVGGGGGGDATTAGGGAAAGGDAAGGDAAGGGDVTAATGDGAATGATGESAATTIE